MHAPWPSHRQVSHVRSGDRLFSILRVHVTKLDYSEGVKVALCRLRGPARRPRVRSTIAER